MQKIIFFDDVHPFLLDRLRQLGFECHEHFTTDLQGIKESIKDAFGIIGRSRFKLDSIFL